MRGKWYGAASLLVAATVTMAGCSSSGTNTGANTGSNTGSSTGANTGPSTTDWSKAQSAQAGGGMAALVAAAKKEGTLNLIAVPRDWAGYGAIIDAFKAKYGLKINSENPNGASADEITAVKSTKGQDSAPDVVDVGNSYALDGAQSGLFAPYKVATWNDIPAALKDSGGLWFSDYGGYLSIGCNAAKVGGTCPKTIKDLDNPAYKDKVALNGDPTQGGCGVLGCLGGGAGQRRLGRQHPARHRLLQEAELRTATSTRRRPRRRPCSRARRRSCSTGTTSTPVTSPTLKKAGITWTTTVPTDGLVSSYYSQAISLNAAHPAAARLWEEFLYSQDKDGGQNGWLRGYARPIELPTMLKNGTADKAAAAKLPAVTDPKPFAPTQAQITEGTDRGEEELGGSGRVVAQDESATGGTGRSWPVPSVQLRLARAVAVLPLRRRVLPGADRVHPLQRVPQDGHVQGNATRPGDPAVHPHHASRVSRRRTSASRSKASIARRWSTA